MDITHDARRALWMEDGGWSGFNNGAKAVYPKEPLHDSMALSQGY